MAAVLVGEAESGNYLDVDVDVPFGGKIEDKEWLERADHPLLNDLILKRLFEQVRRYDLKACRGVCMKWNEYAIPHMHSTFQVTIHGDKSEEQNTETRRIVDFVNVFKSNELGIPFDKYRLGPFRTTDGAGKEFLQICGESVKELVLFQEVQQQLGILENVRTIESVVELLKYSPKLEALTLCGQLVSQSGNAVKLFPDSTPILSDLKKLTVKHFERRQSPFKYCPTLFDELLSAAGNICDITICDYGVEHPELNCITLLLNSIEKLGKESSIQVLKVNRVTSEVVEILKRMAEKLNGLKLKKLTCRFGLNANRNATATIQLATIFKDTMVDLNEIPFGLASGINLTELPEMPKLKSFTLDMKRHGSINLNQIFPVIETLNLNLNTIINEREHYFKWSESQVCPTVKTLIMDTYTRIGSYNFSNILRVFPNLTKLHLECTAVAVPEQVLLQIWGTTQLKSLYLFTSIESWHVDRKMKLDSLITGIPIQGLNEIRHAIPDLERMTAQKRREKISSLVEQHRTQEPSICNLTNLRQLTLGLGVCAGEELFYSPSDLTGYFAIYLMKHLTYLDIQRCEFTKTCCETLVMEMGVEAWRFQKVDEPSRFVPLKQIIPTFQFPSRTRRLCSCNNIDSA